MKNCIFCKIIKGEILAYFIWQDKEFVAFLDKFPVVKGQTLVISKKHHPSDISEMSESIYKKMMIAAKKVIKILKKKLPVERVALVIEGMDVNHAHIKLYPLYTQGKPGSVRELAEAKKRVYFKRYEGYVTTQLGPEASDKNLKRLAGKIKNL